jgi:hypothetical protein
MAIKTLMAITGEYQPKYSNIPPKRLDISEWLTKD